MLKTWSKEQKHIALSSGEAELYAANTGAAEGLGLKSLMADLGIDCKVEVEIDAAAACGIMQRRGLGHVRHVDTQDLWSQLALKEGKFAIKKFGERSIQRMLERNLSEDKIWRGI